VSCSLPQEQWELSLGAGYTAFCRHFQGVGACPHWQVFMRCQQNDEFESLKGGGASASSVTLWYILPSLQLSNKLLLPISEL
jgi:hypothetical protein